MISELKQLGLNEYEARIVEELSTARMNLRELSKKAKIPFGKVYSVIKNLKEKNIVKETNSRPKLIYIENLSNVISSLIEDKKERDTKIFSKLREKVIEKNKNKSNLKFLEIAITKEENKELQLKVFNSAKKEVLQILNIHHNPTINRPSKLEFERLIEELVSRGIVFKSIYPTKVKIPEILAKLSRENPDAFQVKRVDTDFARCDIVDEDKALIKLTSKDVMNSGGNVFIEDERLAKQLKQVFYSLWE